MYSAALISLAKFLGGYSAIPFQVLYDCHWTGLVVILPEFPVCYSVFISISLCIDAQGLFLSWLASPRDEAKGGECSDPGPLG